MNLKKDNIKRIRGIILFTIFVLVLLWNYAKIFDLIAFIWGVLSPFALGGAIAFVLNMPMRFYEDKIFGRAKLAKKKWVRKLARPISFIAALVTVIGLIVLVVFVVVPELGYTILNLGKTLQEFIPEVQNWAINTFAENEELVNWIRQLEFDWDSILQNVIGFLRNGAGSVLDTTYEAAVSIINGITRFVIAFVFACYILIQKERLAIQVKKLMYAFMPEDWRNILLALGGVINKNFSTFLTGQCLEAVILGLMFLITMTIFGLPYALLISVVITFTALIPIFGAFIGCGIGVLLIFIISPIKAFVFIIIFLLLQQIEGNFIYPHVVGSSMGLPSIWVFAAVTLGASLMGIVGMLIFIPLTSVVYTLLRGIVNRRLGLKE